MALPSVSIRFRIFGGSGILVALSLALAGFGVWELLSIETYVARMVLLGDANAHLMEVGQLIERTGRLALHYKATGNPASMEGSGKAQAAAIGWLDTAARGTKSEERRQAYLAMQHGLTDYQTMWERGSGLTKQIRDERADLLGASDKLLAAIGPLLTAARAAGDPGLNQAGDALQASVNALRIASLGFLMTPDKAGSASFAAIAADARKTIDRFASLDPPAAVQSPLAAIKGTLESLSTAFTTQSARILETNELFDQQMRPLVEDLVTRIAAAQVSVRGDLDAAKESLTSSIGTTIKTEKIVGLAALGLGTILALLLGRSVIGPVAGMTMAMQRLAGGDTAVEIPSRDARDEIGSMAKAVEIFRQNALDRIRIEAAQAETERRAAQDKRTSMLSLADGFERSVGGIVAEVAAASADMEETARSMAGMAARASAQAGSVASAATEATGNVRMVAAATEELSTSISEINHQVGRSTQMALQAVADARRTDNTVTGLADGARKIGDVVSLIQTIASQTNLLALNATIEAARAGDAGKGFAVVASEVKNLAGQTAKATQDIASQIAAIQGATTEAVAAIHGIGSKIAQMNDVSNGIAAAIERQSAATRAIAGSVAEATRGTESVSGNIAGVTDASSEVGAAATQVLQAASGVSSRSARMKQEVAGFLATLRAA